MWVSPGKAMGEHGVISERACRVTLKGEGHTLKYKAEIPVYN